MSNAVRLVLLAATYGINAIAAGVATAPSTAAKPDSKNIEAVEFLFPEKQSIGWFYALKM